jgi:hypothetical protein
MRLAAALLALALVRAIPLHAQQPPPDFDAYVKRVMDSFTVPFQDLVLRPVSK